jgi:hypothetical protein
LTFKVSIAFNGDMGNIVTTVAAGVGAYVGKKLAVAWYFHDMALEQTLDLYSETVDGVVMTHTERAIMAANMVQQEYLESIPVFVIAAFLGLGAGWICGRKPPTPASTTISTIVAFLVGGVAAMLIGAYYAYALVGL